MTTFDESKHARDTTGRFAEMTGAEQPDSLAAGSAPTPANTRVTLVIDGKPHAVREPDADQVTLLGEAAGTLHVVGNQLSLLGAGADAADGGQWALQAEVVGPDGTVTDTRTIPCPDIRSLLVVEHHGDYMLVDDLDARGVSLADPDVTWHHDQRINSLSLDDRVDLDEVRGWLTVSPGDGPYLVDAALNYDDPSVLDINVVTTDSLMWNDEFTEDELDENRDIVEAVYQEWFNAEVDVPDSWDAMDVTIRANIDTARASRLMVLEAAHGPYAKFRNETDPGTYGSPYVGTEIRRRIDARNAEAEDQG